MAAVSAPADVPRAARTRAHDPRQTFANLAPQIVSRREADVHPVEVSSFQLLLGASADLSTPDTLVTRRLHINEGIVGSSTQVACLSVQAALPPGRATPLQVIARRSVTVTSPQSPGAGIRSATGLE